MASITESGPATSSRTGTLYFAFGSNLSAHQMSLRLNADRRSSQPVAIARLENYKWIICERGYANVVPSSRSSATGVTPATASSSIANDDTTVWGILYNLSPADEERLDMFEGHDHTRNPHPTPNPSRDLETKKRVPFLQGDWSYNKHFLPVTATKWLEDPAAYGIDPNLPLTQGQSVSTYSAENVAAPATTTSARTFDTVGISGNGLHSTVRALVYVDELRTAPGTINYEYIGRMNRAIRESVALGIPQSWVDNAMRKFIPSDIEVDDEEYVGTDRGYVESETTETPAQVKERVLREKEERQARRT